MNRYSLLALIFSLTALSACSQDSKRDEKLQDKKEPTAGETGSPSGSIDRPALLKAGRSWMYQIQKLNESGAIEILKGSNYPVLVLEPIYTNAGSRDFDVTTMLKSLRLRPDGSLRLLLAYIDIGQAEDYRRYWQSDWVKPTATQAGVPDFLVTIDPDGWSGNYPVAFWDPRWKALWLGEKGFVAELARLGFDGVYLDWVEAYDDPKVIAKGARDGVHPANEMVRFISAIRAAGRAVIPDFLVIAQNAPYLLDETTEKYLSVIDGVAFEDTWYKGTGDAVWESSEAGDRPNTNTGRFETSSLTRQYRKYKSAGLPVLTVDYCIDPAKASQVYRDSHALGFVPLVTRVALSRMTGTP